ncbi:membrane protein [Bathymodiolus azoricus thioautotrophic gill symbiont]|uniref:Membrane protein n=1 Tax=Bathymodiolus azoricus thioautotrophic gill symbiont TaxID=235205 RepID=A0A1H6MZS9_9GAMM|nr:membrane protein [Bathymodiolus azoricus thioautotrophic gill symbiont]
MPLEISASLMSAHIYWEFGLWSLTPLSTIFQLYRGGQYIYIYILRQFFKKLKQNCVCYIIPLYILVHVLRLGLMLYLSTILFLFTMQVLVESTSVFLLNLFYL